MAGLLVTYSVAAAQEKLQDVELLRYAWFEPGSNVLIRIFEDHYTVSRPTGDSTVTIGAPGLGDMVFNHRFYWLDGKLTIVKNGSGPVHQVINHKIERIDRSLDHQFQAHALDFVYRDTLFRHGGYGLWEAHDILTYFSPSSREWEIYLPIRSDVVPPGLFRHTGHLVNDELFVYGGYTLNPYNRTEKIFNREVWKFNFSTRKWQSAGILTSELSEAVLWEQQGIVEHAAQKIFFHLDQMIILEPGANRAEIVQYDPVTFKSQTFTPHPFLLRDTVYAYRSHIHSADYIGGQSEDEILNMRVEYLRIPLSQVRGRMISSGKFMEASIAPWWWLLAVVPLGILAGLYRRKAASGTSKLSGEQAILETGGIRVNGVLYQLNPTGLAVLRLLLSATDDVPSADVLAITSPNEPSYPNQVRIKNRVIRTLNLELRAIFRTGNDIISQTDSAIDRRIKCYRIDRSFFPNSESTTS